MMTTKGQTTETFLKALFSDKTLKPKQRTEQLCAWLLAEPKELEAFIAFAERSKDPVYATCLEAIEYVTKVQPEAINSAGIEFAIKSLQCKAPRIKWEAARVIGNLAHLYPKQLQLATSHLVVNAEHEGTVVRWSSAYALGEILKLRLNTIQELPEVMLVLCDQEEKASIRKIYEKALKTAKYI